jgi:large subunit ribosomal protein L20
LSYSKLIAALKGKGITLDRKILADLAVRDPGGFKAVVEALR